MMLAIVEDIVEDRLTPAQGNVCVGAGRNLLKAVELQLKYGKRENGETIGLPLNNK